MNYRSARLGEEIRKVISELLARGELRDPIFASGFISISAVEVSKDCSNATVYIMSPIASDAELENEHSELIEAFNRAKGFIRSEIGHAIRLRRVPDLYFKIDKSEEYAAHMDEIFARIEREEKGY